MTSTVVFHPLAEKELNDAIDFYENAREGLGYRFLTLIREKISLIAEHPERYSKRHGNYRETITRIFPFVVVYRYDKSRQLVTISAIYHASRNPEHKYRK